MPRRRRLSKQIVVDDVQMLDLHFGGWPNAFASPLARRGAYFRVREQLLADCAAGQRPLAWFDYEAPEPKRAVGQTHIIQGREVTFGETETDYLDRLGLLADWERAELAAIASLSGEPSSKQTHEGEDV